MPDTAYNSEVGLAQRQFEHGQSQLNDQERRTRHEFGIDDPTNPFSRLAELKRTYLNQGKARSANIASQGALYSGQHQASLRNNRRNQEKASAGLRSEYEQLLSGIRDQRQQLTFQREGAGNAAMQAWIARQPVPDVDEPMPQAPTPAARAASNPAQQRARADRQRNRAASQEAAALARARARARRRRRR